MRRGTLFVLAVGLAVGVYGFGAAGRIEEVTYLPNDHPVIHYADKPENDLIAKLQKRLDIGEVKLEYSDRWGYYPALLKYFGVNIDSQVMVFSKTSFQATKISPRAPRAIYFNDEISFGYVQGGDVVEVAAFDPKQGYNFYTLDVQKDDKPEFVRRDTCLQCHQGLGTLGVPGILVTSVYPGPDGMPAFRGANMITDDRSRFDQRWGDGMSPARAVRRTIWAMRSRTTLRNRSFWICRVRRTSSAWSGGSTPRATWRPPAISWRL